MGGSGGGGSFSSADMERMQQAADERLRAIASKSTTLLFICEDTDRNSLDGHVLTSTVFQKDRVLVIDSRQSRELDAAIDSMTFLVPFTDQTKHATFIDVAIDKAMAKRIGGVHVKASSKSLIPAKVAAYRWRSFSWAELESMFK